MDGVENRIRDAEELIAAGGNGKYHVPATLRSVVPLRELEWGTSEEVPRNDMTEEGAVLYEKEDGIGIVTLNRPEKMNALTNDMVFEGVPDALYQADIDPEVRAIIITGTGPRAFCAGLDLTTESMVPEDAAKGRRPKAGLTSVQKPTIAAVNGVAVGGGVEYTIQCDFRIASENARFGWVFSLRGLVPDMGAGTYLLPGIIGRSKALELMYSGKIIDAREAERIGLVSMVVPPDQLMSAAREFASEVTRGAPLALKGIRELTYGAIEMSRENFQARNMEIFRSLALSEDYKEGVQSFFEKRPPVWKGR